VKLKGEKQMKVKRRKCLTATATFAAGLLWLGSGAGNVAAQPATSGANMATPLPEQTPGETTGTETPGTRQDRFTAMVANDRICGQFLNNSLERITRDGNEIPQSDKRPCGIGNCEIPGTSVKFTQHGNKPQAVLVTFVGEWPKPTLDDLPDGAIGTNLPGQAHIFLTIDGKFVDPISQFDPTDLTTNDRGVIVLGQKPEPAPVSGAPLESNGTHGFTFVTQPIPAGDHVASISFLGQRVDSGGAVICVQARSTVVEHD
jgi:hypothetical protein